MAETLSSHAPGQNVEREDDQETQASLGHQGVGEAGVDSLLEEIGEQQRVADPREGRGQHDDGGHGAGPQPEAGVQPSEGDGEDERGGHACEEHAGPCAVAAGEGHAEVEPR